MKTRKLGSLEVSGAGLWQYGAQRRPLRSGCGPGPGHPHDPRGLRARRQVFRYRRSLRPLRQRGTCRRSARACPRPGQNRHQVRLRDRRHERARQPSGAHPPRGRGIAETPQDRPHRPLLPAPGRPDRADRGRGRHGQGADPAREGPALRPVRTQRSDHSPCARGAARRGHPDRIFAD